MGSWLTGARGPFLRQGRRERLRDSGQGIRVSATDEDGAGENHVEQAQAGDCAAEEGAQEKHGQIGKMLEEEVAVPIGGPGEKNEEDAGLETNEAQEYAN